MKHTQGNWIIDTGDSPQEVLIRAVMTEKDRTVEIFDICSFKCDETDNIEANARLISHAPEMLDTLKEALDQLESWNMKNEPTFTMRRIEALIYKITEQ